MIERAQRMAARATTATFVLAAIACLGALAHADDAPLIGQRLQAAYPGIVTAIEGNRVVFADGTALPLDDGAGSKTGDAWLDHPDIEDMFSQPYPKGKLTSAPGRGEDPGRARNEAFFLKVYGDCRSGQVRQQLVDVEWLPGKRRQVLKVTSRNAAADHLRAVSKELDALPAQFDVFLKTEASTYNCRAIAGTERRSAHGLGIAIDIAVKPSGYWRWVKDEKAQAADHTRDLPPEIVEIFEKHGFIWGGKWRHFDTMHFEYRPELLVP